MPSKDEGGDQDGASTSQGTPKIASKPRKPGEREGAASPLPPSGGANLADTLLSDLQLPELWDSKFLLFKPSS